MIYVNNSVEKYVPTVMFTGFKFDFYELKKGDSNKYFPVNYYDTETKFSHVLCITVNDVAVANVGLSLSSEYDIDEQVKVFESAFNFYFNETFKEKSLSFNSVIDIADFIIMALPFNDDLREDYFENKEDSEDFLHYVYKALGK